VTKPYQRSEQAAIPESARGITNTMATAKSPGS